MHPDLPRRAYLTNREKPRGRWLLTRRKSGRKKPSKRHGAIEFNFATWLQGYQQSLRRVAKQKLDSLKKEQRVWGRMAVGRPRKDTLAEEAHRLKQEGKSWRQVAIALFPSTKSEELPQRADAIRKLVKLRERRPAGKNLR